MLESKGQVMVRLSEERREGWKQRMTALPLGGRGVVGWDATRCLDHFSREPKTSLPPRWPAMPAATSITRQMEK